MRVLSTGLQITLLAVIPLICCDCDTALHPKIIYYERSKENDVVGLWAWFSPYSRLESGDLTQWTLPWLSQYVFRGSGCVSDSLDFCLDFFKN
jgi:hypothetical protein